MNGLIVATIAGGLLLDYHWARFGQVAASAIAWIVCFGLLARCDAPSRRTLVACLAIATAGEIFLSLVWGLYQYRLGNIPFFVPPGHVLLFYLGTQIAARLPDKSVPLASCLAAAAITLLALAGRDTLGPLLFALFLLCMALSPSRKLYATMFVLSLAMELYGTWIGNWAWSREVPWLGLTTLNPPVAAGAFYCVLDFLVVLTTGQAGRERERRLDPGGRLQRGLVLAVAADDLDAERQAARAESGRDGHGRHPGLRP
jgi:hypothetical protein